MILPLYVHLNASNQPVHKEGIIRRPGLICLSHFPFMDEVFGYLDQVRFESQKGVAHSQAGRLAVTLTQKLTKFNGMGKYIILYCQ